MNRRGLLKGLMGAPLLGPVLARAGVADVGGLSLGTGSDKLCETASDAWGGSVTGSGGYWQDELARALKKLAGFDEPSERRRQMAGMLHSVTRLDSDLAACRSFSAAARIRIQAERNVDRQLACDREQSSKYLDHIRSMIASEQQSSGSKGWA